MLTNNRPSPRRKPRPISPTPLFTPLAAQAMNTKIAWFDTSALAAYEATPHLPPFVLFPSSEGDIMVYDGAIRLYMTAAEVDAMED